MSSSVRSRLKSWLSDQALPLWATAGWDDAQGGFVEKLAADGKACTQAPKRLVVQARQIYVYAQAHLLDLYPDALRVAERSYAYFSRTYPAGNGSGGWIHLVDGAGAPLDTRRDAYDHAFVLFALAWFYRASRRPDSLDLLHRTARFCDARLADPNGGWYENSEHALPRRQNPHMHLLEAWLAAYEATHEPSFLDRAEEIWDLFRRYFYDAQRGWLREYFGPDWTSLPDGDQRLEPGHFMEWSWLLHRFHAHRPRREFVDCADRLLDEGLRLGYDARRHVLIDECDGGGAVTRPTRRCWPQTELVKAALARYGSTGDKSAVVLAETTIEAIFSDYLDGPVAGAWQDKTDEKGNGLSPFIPASTFYHLVCAFAYALDMLPQD